MFWQTALTTFLMVFVAELGDKTQLATMLLAAESRSLWPVFIGSAGALVLSSLLGVLAGEALTRVISPQVLRAVAGIGFVILGVVMLVKRG